VTAALFLTRLFIIGMRSTQEALHRFLSTEGMPHRSSYHTCL